MGLVAVLLVAEGCQGFKVEKQTSAQKAAYDALKAKAKEASEAATPALLAYLDSAEFRGNISNLPENIQSMSAEQLLVLLNDTLLLSTVTHGLYAADINFGPFNASFLDITLEQLINYNLSFVPTIWERISIGELNSSIPMEQALTIIENVAETTIFLLPNFNSSIDASLPLSQAQDRISYGAMNIYQGAAGDQFYGEVQMVLRPKYYKDMLIVSPYDSGSYSTCCLVNDSFIRENYCHHQFTFNSSENCPEIVLGTVKHWNHLYFQNQQYWSTPVIVNLFQRLFAQPQPDLMLFQEGIYFEADILGNLLLPDAVQFVIGDFSTLFGKPLGQMVTNWCISQGLPLVWAMGIPNVSVPTFISNSTIAAAMNQSFFDPVILSMNITGMPNVTVPTMDLELFQQVWAFANTTLVEDPETQQSSQFWYSTWAKLWNNVPDLHFNPVRPGNCDDVDHCFGVDDSGNCWCRDPHDDLEL